MNFKEALNHIKAFAFDVDGVFSSNFLVSHDGEFLREMNPKDGYAVRYAVEAGYPIAIITGGNSEAVKMRFKNIGVTDIYLNATDKLEDFKDFYMKYQLSAKEVMFMGDDIPDYQAMLACGMAVCPADAVTEIKSISKYISDKKAGKGCVRDVIEQVLRTQGKWHIAQLKSE